MSKWFLALLLSVCHTKSSENENPQKSPLSSIRKKKYGVGHIGKISWGIPYIPADHGTLKKLGAVVEARRASSRGLIINTDQFPLPDEHSDDLEQHIEALTDSEKPDGSVRLAGSTLDYMGRVEVKHNGQWGTVCGFQWGRQDAEVVCRQLGYHVGRVIPLNRPEFGPANHLPVYYNYVECNGDEEKLEDCYAKKTLTEKGSECNRWRRGAAVICGCETETPKNGLRPLCRVSTHYPFDSYSCKYTCQKGFRLEGRNMRFCMEHQNWSAELPRCVRETEPEKSKPAPLAPVTYISKDPVCKLPEMPIECGFNITERENCEKIGCCFNPGGLPDGGFCYHAECQLPKDQNPCLNGGKCIQAPFPRQFDCVCDDKYAGRICEYQPKWSCGRSAWSPQMRHDSTMFFNLWRNENRGRRSINLLEAALSNNNRPSGFKKSMRSSPSSLMGISNDHLRQILEAGRVEKEKKEVSIFDKIKVNIMPPNQRGQLRSDGGHVANTRIVGGDRVESIEQWPWVVMIKQNWKYICAGVLIAPQWVLTAAHCGFEKHIKNNTAPGPSWKVVAGQSSQYELDEGVGISLAIMHDYTHYEDDIPRNDIMMLKLDKILEPTNSINFACLPQSRFDTPKPGDMCVIAGWGVNTEQGDQPEFLHHAKIPILSNSECRLKHTSEKDYESISSDMICAGFNDGGVDACNGDSGGPLMCERPDGSYYLPGIISWGYECAEKDTPGVYTKNANYLDWIHNTMLENAEDNFG